MKFLPLIWAGLMRRKLRTVLTVLSIFVAFLLYGLLGAVRTALDGGVSMDGADRLVVRHKVSIIQTLPESYLARLQQIPGVTLVSGQTWFGGIYRDPKNFFPTVPGDPDPFLKMYPEVLVAPEQVEAWKKTRNGAIVGVTTATRFGWKIGDTVPLQSPIWGNPKGRDQWEFEIVGFYSGAKKNTDASQFFFRYDYFEESRQENKGQIGWYLVKVDDPNRADAIARTIDETFANSPYETKAEPEGAFAQGFAQQLGDIGTIVLAVVSAVFFTILLVAGNTMAQAVRERTEEIGVLKAVGFSNGAVLTFVLLESCLLAALGGFGGLGGAWALTAGGSPVPNVLPILYVPTRQLIVGVFLVFALGLVAGLLPAVQAMRLRIAEALRRGG